MAAVEPATNFERDSELARSLDYDLFAMLLEYVFIVALIN